MNSVRVADHLRLRTEEAEYLYLVSSSSLFELDGASRSVLDALGTERVWPADEARYTLEREHLGSGEILREFLEAGILVPGDVSPRVSIGADFALRRALSGVRGPTAGGDEPPLGNLVLNVSYSCNLRCTYCYAEFGKYGGEEGMMTLDLARQYIDMFVRESGDQRDLNITFFGGEPLMNLPLIQQTVGYSREVEGKTGKRFSYTTTTNGTIMNPALLRFLEENRFSVTVSIDGPKEVHDAIRPFVGGKGSYDLIRKNVDFLLRNYRVAPIGARVTVTRKCLEINRILDHLLEMGFYEAGFSPVSTSHKELALTKEDLGRFYEELGVGGKRYVELALENRYSGLANMSNTLKQVHEGTARAHPCGAGVGLVGTNQKGDLFLCHRFSGDERFRLGNVQTGIDRRKRQRILEDTHFASKLPCRTCWARSLCAGGCHHINHLNTGSISEIFGEQCDWIRAWLKLVMEVYSTLRAKNPRFLTEVLGRRPMEEAEPVSPILFT